MKIIPVPKKITEKGGVLELCGVEIAVELSCDYRISKAAGTLKCELDGVLGSFTKCLVTLGAPTSKSIYISHKDGSDGYTLTVSEDGVRIEGDGAAGAFYGIQTLRQMIKEYGATLPLCEIEDAPDFSERGFYHDVTRGRVPTLEKLKEIAATLSYYKINELQLYVEDAFDFEEYNGVIPKEEKLTAREMTELDDFCYNNFIELVPSLSTFGHLYRFLQSDRWRHLCEYEDWQPWQVYWLERQAHHTIDVSNPESIEVIKSMIDQYIPLFRSNKFNICCDETFDLCKGRNSGKDEGEEYYKYVLKIIEHVKSRGKTVQMWGDVVLGHGDKIDMLPKDVVMLNWNYEKVANEQNVKEIAKSGLKQIVCPGTSAWNRFVEEIDRSKGNITGLAKYGYENGAVGLLNTNWGDFGDICNWGARLYGMVLGAEKGWNPVGVCGEEFDMAASLLLYDSADKNIVKLVYDMGQCERTCDWMEFVYWYSANTKEGRKTELKVDPEKCRENICRIDSIKDELVSLGKEENPVYTDLILACRAIKLMNKVHLMISGDKEYADRAALKAEISEWFREYRVSWLRDDKVSQLELIGEFLDSVTTLF